MSATEAPPDVCSGCPTPLRCANADTCARTPDTDTWRRQLARAWRTRAARRAIARRSRPGRPAPLGTVLGLIVAQLAIAAAGCVAFVVVLQHLAG